MESIFSLTLSTVLLSLALTIPTFAADIQVKGIRIGMTREELVALGAVENAFKEPNNLQIPDFAVGGACLDNIKMQALF